MSHRRSLRLLLLELALPLLMLGAAELACRWYVQRDTAALLPRFFPFPITTGKYLAYQALTPSTAPDVLLMGMSPMLRINAGLLSQQLSDARHTPTRSFNFSAPLQTVGFSERLLRDVLLPIAPPRVIVFGVMPINLLQDETAAKTNNLVLSSPVMMAHDGTLSGRIYGFVIQHIYLIRYRELIRDWLVLPSSADSPEWLKMAQNTDALGDIPFVAPDAPVTTLTAWEGNYRREFAAFDEIMRTTLFFDNLLSFARTCAAAGVRLLFLNNAVHPLFNQLLPHGRADYDRYLFRLRDVASAAAVPLCEPAPDGIAASDLFQDTHHHNLRGSKWLTEQLTTCLMHMGALGERAR